MVHVSKEDWARAGGARRNRMKADQHWEMAGLARQDGDMVDAERHTKLAREYEAAYHAEKPG